MNVTLSSEEVKDLVERHIQKSLASGLVVAATAITGGSGSGTTQCNHEIYVSFDIIKRDAHD
jgi:hypothetical protein